MAKKQESPKLDATVKATEFKGPKFPAPEYVKPWTDFNKRFPLGEVATIWRRMWNEHEQEWELKEMEILCLEKAQNCFYFEDDNGKRKGCPWWAVHDFSFAGSDSLEADGSGGDPEQREEQGPDSGDGSI